MDETRKYIKEALAVRARHLTPLAGRLLLDLKSCGVDNRDVGPDHMARKQVSSGIVLASLGFWDEALLQWQIAVALDPLNSDARNNLAVAYEREGDAVAARSHYERAIAMEANNIYIRHNYDLHIRTGPRPTRNEEWAEAEKLATCH